MGYYKVKNITNTLAKRDSQKDKDLKISLNNGLFPIEQTIKSGSEVLIECMRIPTELQKLRVKGLVTILESSKNEYLAQLKELDKPEQPKAVDKKSVSKKSKKNETASTKSSSSSSSSSSSKSSSSSSNKKKSSTTTTVSGHTES